MDQQNENGATGAILGLGSFDAEKGLGSPTIKACCLIPFFSTIINPDRRNRRSHYHHQSILSIAWASLSARRSTAQYHVSPDTDFKIPAFSDVGELGPGFAGDAALEGGFDENGDPYEAS